MLWYPNWWLKHNLWLLHSSGLCLSPLIPNCFVAQQPSVFIPFPALPSSGWVSCTTWIYNPYNTLICLYLLHMNYKLPNFLSTLLPFVPMSLVKVSSNTGCSTGPSWPGPEGTNRPDVPACPLPGCPHTLPTVLDPISTPQDCQSLPWQYSGSTGLQLPAALPWPPSWAPVGPHPGLGSASAGPDASGWGCHGCPPAALLLSGAVCQAQAARPPHLGGAQWPLVSGSLQPGSTLTLP